jgi:hypothetical protein
MSKWRFRQDLNLHTDTLEISALPLSYGSLVGGDGLKPSTFSIARNALSLSYPPETLHQIEIPIDRINLRSFRRSKTQGSNRRHVIELGITEISNQSTWNSLIQSFMIRTHQMLQGRTSKNDFYSMILFVCLNSIWSLFESFKEGIKKSVTRLSSDFTSCHIKIRSNYSIKPIWVWISNDLTLINLQHFVNLSKRRCIRSKVFNH